MNLSRPRFARAFKVLLTTVLATSAILVPTSTASAADTETPVLTSFSVSANEVTTGQQVTFSYVASDSAGELSRLRIEYSNFGRTNILTFPGPLPLAGSVSFTVPDTWWNGTAYAMWVEVSDLEGNRLVNYRDGKSYRWPTGATGPSSHNVPFTAGDLIVSGSSADSTIPTLTSISVTGVASPGQTISGHYKVTDLSGSLTSVVLSFRDPFQIERTLSASGAGPFPLDGVVDLVIPATWPNGSYLLDRVRLADANGTTGDYIQGGRVFVPSPGAQGPPSHAVDFGPATFTVSGSTADWTPPQITSLSLTGSPTPPGGTATLAYTATSEDPMAYVSFMYVQQSDPVGNQKVFGAVPTGLTGTQKVSIALDKPVGPYILQDVYLQDSKGNSITYHRDGTTSQGPGFRTGTHTLAMPALDLLVATRPSAPHVTDVLAGIGSALVCWDAVVPIGSPISGYTVTARPGGRTVTTGGSATYVWLTGLTNGTAYTFTVTATNGVGTSTASAPSTAVTAGSSVQRYIARVYADLFNRVPDPSGLASWTAKLNSGTPRVAVANGITSSTEYRSKLITGSYAHYLGREPDTRGLANWLAAMERSATIEQMESGFIASPEYYAKAGSTDARWVTKLYSDVLGRSPAPGEIAAWTTHLRVGMRRDQVAVGFLMSTERLGTLVNGYYQDLLGRGIDPAGRRGWVGILQAGGRDEAIIGGIIASAEYYGRV
jgi:hypothetical protein